MLHRRTGLLVSRPTEPAGRSAVLPPAPLRSSVSAAAPAKPASEPVPQPVKKLAPAFGPNVPMETLPAPTFAQGTAPPAAPAPSEPGGEKPASGPSAVPPVKTAEGWVLRILSWKPGPAKGSMDINELEPLAAVPFTGTAFTLGQLLAAAKMKPRDYAFDLQGFLRVTEEGRHSFLAEIDVAKKASSTACRTRLVINDTEILSATATVGLQDGLMATNGVELSPGLYKTQWSIYFKTAWYPADAVSVSLKVRSPSSDLPPSMGPGTPAPGTIVHLIKETPRT